MWLEHGQKLSALQKAWFMAVKVLSGTKPSLYNFQGCLPSLPVPNLRSTTTKWLASVKPMLDDKEYKEMEDKVASFHKNEGWKLQIFLFVQSLYKTSWLWDWWEKYVYLRGRAPIMINSNYYVIDSLDWVPTGNQAARTAGLLNQADKFKALVDWERLEPMRLQKTIPWCMKQYERIFDTTRVPGKECDVVVHYELDPQRYCAVTRKGVWYKLPMTVKGANGQWRTALPHELEKKIEWIIQDADANPAGPGEDALAALTGWHRGRWAESREDHFWEGVNRESLDIVERAFMHFALEDKSPNSMTDHARKLMHADGKTIWFDKSVTFMSFPDGHSGLSAEHSYADALTVAHMWEWVTTGERLQGGIYRDDGHCRGYGDSAFEQVALANPKRLGWSVTPPMRKSIDEALAHNTELIADLDLNVFKHDALRQGLHEESAHLAGRVLSDRDAARVQDGRGQARADIRGVGHAPLRAGPHRDSPLTLDRERGVRRRHARQERVGQGPRRRAPRRRRQAREPVQARHGRPGHRPPPLWCAPPHCPTPVIRRA